MVGHTRERLGGGGAQHSSLPPTRDEFVLSGGGAGGWGVEWEPCEAGSDWRCQRGRRIIF